MEKRDLIAKKSMRWLTEERFAFIWDEKLIIANYDRDRKSLMILTRMEPEEQFDVVEWFNREILNELVIEEPEIKEDKKEKKEKKKEEDEDEEDSDRFR